MNKSTDGTYAKNTIEMRRKYEACQSATEILDVAKNILIDSQHQSSIPFAVNKINNEIEAARTHIAIMHSLILYPYIDFKLSNSLRLAHRLVELTNNSEIHGNSNGNSIYGNDQIFVNSTENAGAYLLLARLMYLNNGDQALNFLKILEKSFSDCGYLEQSYEAIILHALYSMKEYSPREIIKFDENKSENKDESRDENDSLQDDNCNNENYNYNKIHDNTYCYSYHPADYHFHPYFHPYFHIYFHQILSFLWDYTLSLKTMHVK